MDRGAARHEALRERLSAGETAEARRDESVRRGEAVRGDAALRTGRWGANGPRTLLAVARLSLHAVSLGSRARAPRALALGARGAALAAAAEANAADVAATASVVDAIATTAPEDRARRRRAGPVQRAAPDDILPRGSRATRDERRRRKAAPRGPARRTVRARRLRRRLTVPDGDDA